MKTPSEYLFEIFLKTFKRLSEDNYYILEQADKFIIWLVGYSIGGLYLLSTQEIVVDVYWVIFFLTSSILCVLLYKVISLLYRYYYRYCEFLFINMLDYKNEVMSVNPEGLVDIVSIDEASSKFKSDFGEDPLVGHSYDFPSMSSVEKERILNYIKQKHEIFKDYAKKDLDYGKTSISESLKYVYGVSDKKLKRFMDFDNHSNKWYSVKLSITFYASFILFASSCISFALAILLLVIKNA